MSNLVNRAVTPAQGAERLSKSAAFKLGYEDYIKVRHFNYDHSEKSVAIDYERGRSFAIWCQHTRAPRSTWRNGVAAKTVVERIISAIRSQYVI